ncbi:putative phospholipase D active site-containing protein [Rosellinia necatrix]|uniref:Phospholipase n=1 Tax=Rosellinia necatrix TaxID=77044 RepID=A0A1S7UI34_ROSNE|nr:putative phospholipase D active site-containing protein [Rosellinia necatrix]
MDRLLRKAEHVVKEHILKDVLGVDDKEDTPQEQVHPNQIDIQPVDTAHRFQSFSPQSSGNAKWYVDGASYFWAVSMALEEARESIYILDWWLSPELYLRRPPSRNERYRLDNMLRDAAERGVDVNIIVYKEVTQALTLDSAHTRHALEALHPNIKVFRHPDHLPTSRSRLQQAFSGLSLDNLKMNSLGLSKISGDALKELYGSFGDTVLYWAHHEKLCVVDRHVVFMGGLDMCFGRYDTNSHPIADAHPGNLDAIVFPGQDFNNARVFDFEGVNNWDHNQLDRANNSRMGWSDIAISLSGPIVNNLVDHFTDRWNFIFDEKYNKKNPGKYQRLEERGQEDDHYFPRPDFGGIENRLTRGVRHGVRHFMGDEGDDSYERRRSRSSSRDSDDYRRTNIQLCRSASDWSSGHPTEHSIANAYIHAIESAHHYVYIENQFFITATGAKQYPIENKIGASIVSRIVRAHSNREKFRVIVLMPAVPAFAGDLKSDGALGTRAIMEYQYNSINRGGYSIIECLKRQGINNWQRYIGFYNLRNYDRINISSTMGQAEERSGVRYDDARREHDDYVGRRGGGGHYDQYDRYQSAASRVPDRTWDTVSACYMDGGPDIRSVPWHGDEESEMNSFVSEELYIHSKVLIADDKLVICGSANLNDRSQLGNHDSEIAVVIEDQDSISSQMDGRPYRASRFATSLRRQLWRKHLGWLPDERCDRPTRNWTPVTRDPQDYDWGSPADRAVEDPLSDDFWRSWTETARTNTEVFSKVFHNVPNDRVRNWDDYDQFFGRHFIIPGVEMKEEDKRGRVPYGHVVPEEFEGGAAEVKEWLSRVRGTLVEMPLNFLIEVEDLAKEGLSLNAFTDELYT